MNKAKKPMSLQQQLNRISTNVKTSLHNLRVTQQKFQKLKAKAQTTPLKAADLSELLDQTVTALEALGSSIGFSGVVAEHNLQSHLQPIYTGQLMDHHKLEALIALLEEKGVLRSSELLGKEKELLAEAKAKMEKAHEGRSTPSPLVGPDGSPLSSAPPSSQGESLRGAKGADQAGA